MTAEHRDEQAFDGGLHDQPSTPPGADAAVNGGGAGDPGFVATPVEEEVEEALTDGEVEVDEAGEVPAAAEPADGAAPSAGAGPSVPDPLAEAERQRDEYLALAQRTQADFDNFRKRAAREAAASGARAKAGLARELLPVVDNLERALATAGEADEGFAQGVRLVHAELVGALERSGIAAFEPAGERFDPQVHEAISTRPADGADPGVVVDVVEKGYRLDETVLRPARVVVSA